MYQILRELFGFSCSFPVLPLDACSCSTFDFFPPTTHMDSFKVHDLSWRKKVMTSTLSPAVGEELLSKIENRTARIGLIGLGYVGLPLVLLFSEQRFRVTGFDIDAKKVKVLGEGGSYIYRIPATDVQQARQRGFEATTDYSMISEMDAIIICVPTPLDEHMEPDMSYIVSTVESIAPYLRPQQLVVLESTTYPGTTEEVMIPILERKNPLGLKAEREGQESDNSF